MKKFGQAGAQFKRVLANDSEHAEARLGLGISQVKSGLPVGRENIRTALAVEPGLAAKLELYEISMGAN